MKLVTGNTYPVKVGLHALGGRWNAEKKGWEVPDDKYEEACKLVENAPVDSGERKPFVHTVCRTCGARASRYVRIYKSGECQDCYEERKMGY